MDIVSALLVGAGFLFLGYEQTRANLRIRRLETILRTVLDDEDLPC